MKLVASIVAAGCFFFGKAGAQVRILPRTTLPDSIESYVLQVSNDGGIAMTRVELRIPRSVKVISIGEMASGWTGAATPDGSRMSSLVWTGALPAGRFAQFGFIAKNPNANVRLFWPVIATLADGRTVSWWTGGRATTKAPVTVVFAPAANGMLGFALLVCLVAFLLALVGLILAIRSGRGDVAGFQPGSD